VNSADFYFQELSARADNTRKSVILDELILVHQKIFYVTCQSGQTKEIAPYQVTKLFSLSIYLAI